MLDVLHGVAVSFSKHGGGEAVRTKLDSDHSSDGAATKRPEDRITDAGDYVLNALFDSNTSSLEHVLPSVHISAKRSIKFANSLGSPFISLCDDDDDFDDSSDGGRKFRGKRAKSAPRDSDSNGSSDDDENKIKVRREKNRLAARKCRAKKLQFMLEMDNKMRELTQKNEDMRVQMMTIQKMFSREVKLREAMKVILQARWNSANPFPGYTVNDIIIGLESGTLDVNTILSATSKPSVLSGGYTNNNCAYDALFPGMMYDDACYGGPAALFGGSGIGSGLPYRDAATVAAPFLTGLSLPLGSDVLPEIPLHSRPIGQCVTTGASPLPVKHEHQQAASPLPSGVGAADMANGTSYGSCASGTPQTIVIRGATSAADGSATVTTQYMLPAGRMHACE